MDVLLIALFLVVCSVQAAFRQEGLCSCLEKRRENRKDLRETTPPHHAQVFVSMRISSSGFSLSPSLSRSLALDVFVKIAYRCWESEPELRGGFVDILRDLESSEEGYPTVVVEPQQEGDGPLAAVEQVRGRDVFFFFFLGKGEFCFSSLAFSSRSSLAIAPTVRLTVCSTCVWWRGASCGPRRLLPALLCSILQSKSRGRCCCGFMV